MKFVRVERYRFVDQADQGLIALRDDHGWLWCRALIMQGDFQSAGPYFDAEFAVAFGVHPEPIDTQPFPRIDSEVGSAQVTSLDEGLNSP